jgi:ketosteroid isomerase-like protein
MIRVEASGQCAIASYQLLVHTKHPDGKVTDESAFETDVWCNTDGAWKIVHVHYSVTPTK